MTRKNRWLDKQAHLFLITQQCAILKCISYHPTKRFIYLNKGMN